MITVVTLLFFFSLSNCLPQQNASISECSISFPLTTGTIGDKVVVVDADGARAKLACVNWYGAHMEGHVVNGLDKQTISSIAKTISELGFNCIRLPFSLEQFFEDPVIEVIFSRTYTLSNILSPGQPGLCQS